MGDIADDECSFGFGGLEPWDLPPVSADRWRTTDGRYLAPHQFENDHLLNTIRMLERTGPNHPMYAKLLVEARVRGLR